MPNAIYYVSYKLKKGKSVQEFFLATEKLNNEILSKQKSYVSYKQLYDGKIWADVCTFETMEDLNNFIKASSEPSEISKKFYSFINFFTCKEHRFSVEKSY